MTFWWVMMPSSLRAGRDEALPMLRNKFILWGKMGAAKEFYSFRERMPFFNWLAVWYTVPYLWIWFWCGEEVPSRTVIHDWFHSVCRCKSFSDMRILVHPALLRISTGNSHSGLKCPCNLISFHHAHYFLLVIRAIWREIPPNRSTLWYPTQLQFK